MGEKLSIANNKKCRHVKIISAEQSQPVKLPKNQRWEERMRFDRFMAQRHKARGHTIFDNKNTNNRYSKEFKNHVVQEYLQDLGSSSYLAAKYGIPKHSTVLEQVKKYNGCEELKDYLPNPEIYMADTLKVSKEKT